MPPPSASSATWAVIPPLALALASALGRGTSAAEPVPALERAAQELAARFEAAEPERGLVALAVSAPGAEALAAPLETALSAALARRGYAVALLRGPRAADAEAAARSLRADRLLRVAAGLVPGRRELGLAAEDLSTAPSFFLQRTPGVRAGGGRLLAASVPADAAALLLARAGAQAAGASAIAVRPLFAVGDRVVALAAGDAAGDGTTALAVVTAGALSVHAPGGELLARRRLPPPGPVRRPAAAVAIGDYGGGRIACQLAGGGSGEVLALAGGALRPTAELAAAPLGAAGAERVFGAFLPARAALADLLLPHVDASAQPRSSREIVSFAVAPHPGRVAFAALYGDGALLLLGPDRSPAGPPLTGVGAGFALADLDGDAEPELVASGVEQGPADRIRVLRLGPDGGEPILDSPVPGAVVAGAAGDLTGDGLDDAVLAAVLPSGETQLWLVTADRRRPASGAGP